MPTTETSPPTLTTRQSEVLALLAEGLGYREIGRRLYLAKPTIRSHVLGLYRALGATNGPHAVHLAYQAGLLPVGGDTR